MHNLTGIYDITIFKTMNGLRQDSYITPAVFIVTTYIYVGRLRSAPTPPPPSSDAGGWG